MRALYVHETGLRNLRLHRIHFLIFLFGWFLCFASFFYSICSNLGRVSASAKEIWSNTLCIHVHTMARKQRHWDEHYNIILDMKAWLESLRTCIQKIPDYAPSFPSTLHMYSMWHLAVPAFPPQPVKTMIGILVWCAKLVLQGFHFSMAPQQLPVCQCLQQDQIIWSHEWGPWMTLTGSAGSMSWFQATRQ